MSLTTQTNRRADQQRKYAQLVLIANTAMLLFLSVADRVLKNVYQYPVAGAFYELLWLPFLLCLFLSPLICLFLSIRNKGKTRIYAAIAFLISLLYLFILTRL